MQEAPVRTRSDPLHARVGATGPDTIRQKALTEPLARPPDRSPPTMLPGTRSVRPCLPPLPHTAPSGGPEFPPLLTAPLELAKAVGSQASRRQWRQWRRIRTACVVQGSGPRGPQGWRVRATGTASRVADASSFPHAVANAPEKPTGARVAGTLPRNSGGAASASLFSMRARRFTHVTACPLAEPSKRRPFGSGLLQSHVVTSMHRCDSFLLERQPAAQDSHLLDRTAFSRHKTSLKSAVAGLRDLFLLGLSAPRVALQGGLRPWETPCQVRWLCADAGVVRLAERRASTGRVLDRLTRGHPFGSCAGVPGPNGG